MIQKVVRIGNSVGVVIPKGLRAGLTIGSKVKVVRKKKDIVISPAEDSIARGVDARFMKMVDEFMNDHKDVLKQLAKR